MVIIRDGNQGAGTAGLARKSLLRDGIGAPFGKPAKLRDEFKVGRVESGTDRKRDGLQVNLRDFENPQP
ncbi:hypothetical protein F2Q70_00019673 [Brassica cretica]|uniref:Uncharacterized protein n=1 Tax=Brassica cretica TaxID=69181 RepID=A0A8S9GS42_BRACR|nr:hypothetical protein F2Q70_00019673 [Brassica cretica]